jgi:dienelactone hydrolase
MTFAGKLLHLAPVILFLVLNGCGEATPEQGSRSLPDARLGFKTKLVSRATDRTPASEPPPQLFRKISFDSPAGRLAAYMSQVPDDGTKRPAIIWITGGDCNSIDDSVWRKASPSNDQTASAYRDSGIVMMFPSLRGGNDNPGAKEGFLGEVTDVLAAADYLARQESVDPKRLYLGGHSTGGTLVLLVAESSDRFRAVFSFGPASDVGNYDPQFLPFDTSNPRELELRSPGRWLRSVKSPTFVFEGTIQPSNLASLQAMSRATTNPLVHFHTVSGANHFSILAPTNKLIARKVLQDEGATTNISFTEKELADLFTRRSE